jgi:diguanylate cyclase (GGDEF)-like protein/putative nucleotidyltransferase with HDIG domain
MTTRAWFYIWSIFLTGIGLSAYAFLQPATEIAWEAFATLTMLATIAQVVKAQAPNHKSYYGTQVLFFAGILLLNPTMLVLLMLIPHLVEWIWERRKRSEYLRAWYIQPFNIAMAVIVAFAARQTYLLLNGGTLEFDGVMSLVAATAAIGVYVLLNHLIVALVLVLARGVSWKDTSIFDLDELVPDLINLAMGLTAGVVWSINPWLIVPALAPMVLVYRAMMIPQLKHEASVDAKTSLLNALHLNRQFDAELGRADRFDHGLALIMADLDLLRNVNNTYGHLAGDIVLGELGKLINAHLRSYEIAGRFGGEEFAIVLPETNIEEARERAETLRRIIERHPISIPTQSEPIFVTMSLGVAEFPNDATDRDGLVQIADAALYRAKANGRNQVVCAGEVPTAMAPAVGTATVEPTTTGSHTEQPVERANLVAPVPTKLVAEAAVPAAVHTRAVTTSANETKTRTPQTDTKPIYNDEEANQLASAIEGKPVRAAARLQPTSAKHPEKPTEQPALPTRLWGFIAIVVLAGIAVGSTLLFVSPREFSTGYLLSLGILMLSAMLAEIYLVDLYGESSVSVSIAVAFAAAVITGMPGVILVSAVIAITAVTASANRRKPQLERVAFNWAAHTLAGAVPVVFFADFDVSMELGALMYDGMLLLISAWLYFMIDTGLVAIALALSTGQRLQKVWSERFAWLAGHYMLLSTVGLTMGLAHASMGLLGLFIFLTPVAASRNALKQYAERTRQSMQELQRLNRELKRANQSITHANDSIRQYNDELLLTLAKVIDTRDPSVAGHSARVADFAVAIAQDLAMPASQVEEIRQAALLHDIGKIGISERILHKPDKLTDEEYELIKTHADLGANLIDTSQSLRHLAPAVRHHHERWDGRGYPARLAGDEIPLEARILAVCDAAEVILSDRPYSPGQSLEAAIREVKRCAGTHFDPAIAASFARIAGKPAAATEEHTLLERAAGDDTLVISGPFNELSRLRMQHHVRIAS